MSWSIGPIGCAATAVPTFFPVVKLADKFMNTKWGGRQRPFLQILKWIAMGGDGALPAPESQVQIERAPAAPLDRKDEPTAAPTEIVHEPSASEILDDELPRLQKADRNQAPGGQVDRRAHAFERALDATQTHIQRAYGKKGR